LGVLFIASSTGTLPTLISMPCMCLPMTLTRIRPYRRRGCPAQPRGRRERRKARGRARDLAAADRRGVRAHTRVDRPRRYSDNPLPVPYLAPQTQRFSRGAAVRWIFVLVCKSMMFPKRFVLLTGPPQARI
jgi:hypothetical protein